MTVSVHNPDQYMASLRQIVAQGRKRIGLLVGAGAPAGTLSPETNEPLIPAVAQLTIKVLASLPKKAYEEALNGIKADLKLADPNIEHILSRARSLAGVIGSTKVHGLDGDGYKNLSEEVCKQIGIL